MASAIHVVGLSDPDLNGSYDVIGVFNNYPLYYKYISNSNSAYILYRDQYLPYTYQPAYFIVKRTQIPGSSAIYIPKYLSYGNSIFGTWYTLMGNTSGEDNLFSFNLYDSSSGSTTSESSMSESSISESTISGVSGSQSSASESSESPSSKSTNSSSSTSSESHSSESWSSWSLPSSVTVSFSSSSSTGYIKAHEDEELKHYEESTSAVYE